MVSLPFPEETTAVTRSDPNTKFRTLPIDRLWLDLHANVTRNHDAASMTELMNRVHRYLAVRFNVHRGLLFAA